jgi:hypothetical protein
MSITANESHCTLCFRMHQPGPCPPTEPDAIPEQRPRAAERTESLQEMLARMQERVAAMPDPTPEPERAPPGPCDACGLDRQWEQTVSYGDGISGPRRYGYRAECRVCALCDDLPESFRVLNFGSEELARRVRRRDAIGEAQEAAKAMRVVLRGPSGAGKTTLGCAMFRWRASVKGERNTFMHARALGLARSQHPLGEGEAPAVVQALGARILLLDDVGLEVHVATSAIADVLFERYAHKRPTWVTTAMTEADMSQRYGDGIARRVFEGARIIDCGGRP